MPYDLPVQTLCRDCGRRPAADAGICPACGSARVLAHAELHDLAIAHLDCDAFYAAIEKRGRPELQGVPVIVGGRHRGVVAACCYVARTYGVRSVMPMFQALRVCPDAVVIRPDMKKYAAVGRNVRAMVLELTPLVEPLSPNPSPPVDPPSLSNHGRASKACPKQYPPADSAATVGLSGSFAAPPSRTSERIPALAARPGAGGYSPRLTAAAMR